MIKLKLIIGIGNPEKQYQNTRHNVGFMFLDYLAKKLGAINFELDKKSNSLTSRTKLNKTPVILAKPQTYVNKSGDAVKKLCSIFQADASVGSPTASRRGIPYSMLIVVQDDLDVPFGNTKISFDKNSGGHKGIESVMKSLKTKKFYRLRIGLAKPALQKARQQSDKKRDEFVRNYVLSKFSKSESEKLKEIFKEAYNKLILEIKK